MPKILLALSILLVACAADVGYGKDKSVANQYPVILEINDSGKVVSVTMPETTPETIKQKTLAAFMGKKVGIKRKFGKAIDYKQKLTISTKHLLDKSQISQR